MRRLLALSILIAASAAAPAAAEARLPARALLATCDRSGHAAVFVGRMATPPPATRLQMRFVLQARSPGEHWSRVAVPGFSAWKTSDAGRSAYTYTKRVQQLAGPAAYRVIVRFRWLASDGSVLHRARRVSAACRQPDPRADLEVSALQVQPAARADHRRYAVTLENTGRSEAGASRLELDLGDGLAPLTAAVDPMAAGEERTVMLSGRACTPGATLTATADAGDAVDERDEDDDALAVACP